MNGDPGDSTRESSPTDPRPPRVFISYAHDDAAFSDLVRLLYEFLRIDCGVDAVVDRVAAESPQDWSAWMIRQMAEADFILCAVSPQYRAAPRHPPRCPVGDRPAPRALPRRPRRGPGPPRPIRLVEQCRRRGARTWSSTAACPTHSWLDGS